RLGLGRLVAPQRAVWQMDPRRLGLGLAVALRGGWLGASVAVRLGRGRAGRLLLAPAAAPRAAPSLLLGRLVGRNLAILLGLRLWLCLTLFVFDGLRLLGLLGLFDLAGGLLLGLLLHR